MFLFSDNLLAFREVVRVNFVIKLEDGTYFNPKIASGKVPDIQSAEKFHSKSIAKRILAQALVKDVGLEEIIQVKK